MSFIGMENILFHNICIDVLEQCIDFYSFIFFNGTTDDDSNFYSEV